MCRGMHWRNKWKQLGTEVEGDVSRRAKSGRFEIRLPIWVWLKIKEEGQTADFGPCFHLPGQPILEHRFFEPQPFVPMPTSLCDALLIAFKTQSAVKRLLFVSLNAVVCNLSFGNFVLFGKTISVAKKQFGLFFGPSTQEVRKFWDSSLVVGREGAGGQCPKMCLRGSLWGPQDLRN